MKLKEKDVMAYIDPVMSAHNILYTRFNTGATKCGERWIKYGKNGWADYLGCTLDGRFIAIETKSSNWETI